MANEPVPSTTNYPAPDNETSVDEVVFDDKGIKYKIHEYLRSGTGVPTFTAQKGTLYIREDGSTSTERLYINTDGAVAWTNIPASA